MSGGLTWAYESIEREEKLKSLGLCTECQKSKCNCEKNNRIGKLKLQIKINRDEIKYCLKNIKQAQRELKKLREK